MKSNKYPVCYPLEIVLVAPDTDKQLHVIVKNDAGFEEVMYCYAEAERRVGRK